MVNCILTPGEEQTLKVSFNDEIGCYSLQRRAVEVDDGAVTGGDEDAHVGSLELTTEKAFEHSAATVGLVLEYGLELAASLIYLH